MQGYQCLIYLFDVCARFVKWYQCLFDHLMFVQALCKGINVCFIFLMFAQANLPSRQTSKIRGRESLWNVKAKSQRHKISSQLYTIISSSNLLPDVESVQCFENLSYC